MKDCSGPVVFTMAQPCGCSHIQSWQFISLSWQSPGGKSQSGNKKKSKIDREVDVDNNSMKCVASFGICNKKICNLT